MKDKETDINKIIALRRAALFNIKVRNQGVKDLLRIDYERQKELEMERDKLAVILKTKIGIENVDDYLLPIKKKEKDENINKYKNRNR